MTFSFPLSDLFYYIRFFGGCRLYLYYTTPTCTEVGNPIEGLKVGDKYLDFIINVKSGSATDEHIYVNVADLVDTYTAGDNIKIEDNKISVKSKIGFGNEALAGNGSNAFTSLEESQLKMVGTSGAYETVVTPGDIQISYLSDVDGAHTVSLQDLPKKANAEDLSAIATSGKVTDLVQAADDVLIFDCGNATI